MAHGGLDGSRADFVASFTPKCRSGASEIAVNHFSAGLVQEAMKTTTTLRILFTLAILAGLAAAPSAQTFRWQAGSQNDEARVRARVETALRRAQRATERRLNDIDRQIEMKLRAADRQAQLAERNANRVAQQAERQARARADAQLRRQLRGDRRNNGAFYLNRGFSRDMNYGASAGAQVGTDADPCRNSDRYRDDDYRQHCEVRESTMPAGPLNVDAGSNGGIVVEAWDRNEIRVRAVVQGSAKDDARAREIAGQVQVQASGGRVYATGPTLDRREWWSVSYRINVPKRNDLDLRASNGGITIAGVNGNMRFDTTNGGVKLEDIGGRVNGSTRNGGLNVMLAGDRWDGEGLDVETSNGGVTLSLPENYNAELETRTVNGGLRIDFPVTVQGELTGRRGLTTTLGAGGPLVRARTTNGGVRITRR
jgi:hypothetical protein